MTPPRRPQRRASTRTSLGNFHNMNYLRAIVIVDRCFQIIFEKILFILQIGQSSLRSVLGAYCVAFPDDGYCQGACFTNERGLRPYAGQAPVAATLLMHMPPSHAYHCLVQICRHYLKMYYAPGLVGFRRF